MYYIIIIEFVANSLYHHWLPHFYMTGRPILPERLPRPNNGDLWSLKVKLFENIVIINVFSAHTCFRDPYEAIQFITFTIFSILNGLICEQPKSVPIYLISP